MFTSYMISSCEFASFVEQSEDGFVIILIVCLFSHTSPEASK